jgi:hypothetical protein
MLRVGETLCGDASAYPAVEKMNDLPPHGNLAQSRGVTDDVEACDTD